jgi:hypothetical protein
MGFRIGLGATLACVAIVLAAGGPVAPAHAAGADLSYNQVTRIIMGGGPAPAPGSYAAGSFDADFQAATPPKKSGGLFGMVKTMMNAVHSGFGSTMYYLNNMERDDNLQGQSGTITIPAKNETINLNFANKTYWISTPNPMRMTQTMPPMAPQPRQSMAPPQPGKAKVAITISTTSLGSKNLGGVNADGYQMTFKVVSSQATGSCQNGTFQSSMTEFVSSYAEPLITWPTSGTRPAAPPPMANPETAALSPGCVPTVTARLHKGPVAPPDRLVVWEMLTANAGAAAQSGGLQMVIERGDVKTLGPGDADLFAPPAGFTQQQPASSP